jgi:hypothetical protein
MHQTAAVALGSQPATTLIAEGEGNQYRVAKPC